METLAKPQNQIVNKNSILFNYDKLILMNVNESIVRNKVLFMMTMNSELMPECHSHLHVFYKFDDVNICYR